jgi:phospholipase/carboxylesterase
MGLPYWSAAGALVLASALAGCASPSESPRPESEPVGAAQPGPGRITARPGRGGGNCRPGEHTLRLGEGRTALMRVTAGTRGGKKALILTLHGAGSGGARGGLYAFRGGWDASGVVMVAPAAEGNTWSFFRGRDTDLPFVDRGLARAFARCRVDPRLIGVGGFSDGATYALTLGLTNGNLFRAVMALSPGGVLAENSVGKPRVFIAHGTLDNVLPIERTSEVIVRELRKLGYAVTYRRFRGGHEARPEISRAAVRWFVRR